MTSEISEVPQIIAKQAAVQSIHPLLDETDGNFGIRRNISKDKSAPAPGLQKLQDYLDRQDVPALVHELSEVYLQSTHWMLQVDGVLVSETRYLTHEQYLSRNFSMINSDNSESLDPDRVWILGANNSGTNYWHWHAQCLPAVLHALETIPMCDHKRVSILTGQLQSWQREGLVALGLVPEQIMEVPRGKSVHIKNLRYSDLLSSRQVFGKNHARRRTAALLLKASRALTGSTDIKSRRLYISRGDSKRRPLLNEQELSRETGRMGFATITNTGMSLMEQICLYEAADVVVAPHGAGSTNMFFMRAGSSFVEFQQASHVNAGPLSLGKSSAILPYAEVFSDDGRGQATEGWAVDMQRALSLIRMAVDE